MRYYIVNKDKNRRNLYTKLESSYKLIKVLQQTTQLQINLTSYYSVILKSLNKLSSKNASISRIKRRCILTGRAKSVYKDFGLSRMQLRKLASFGLLSGVKKSSW